MGYAKQFLNYESIDIYGAQEAVKAIRSDHRFFSTTECLLNRETANGYLVVSAEIESEEYNQHAVQIVLRSVVNFFERSKKINDPIAALKDAILQANRQLYFAAMHDENLKGITLSVVASLLRDKLLYYAYVGNNNLFLVSNKQAKRLTPGISQVEGDEHEEIPLVNSSKIDPDLAINVCDGPLVPDNKDFIITVPKAYVYTSDNLISEIFQHENMDVIAGEFLKEALKMQGNQPRTFAITRMNLLGGKGSEFGDGSWIYGGIFARIIEFMTSPYVLLAMAILIVMLVLYLL